MTTPFLNRPQYTPAVHLALVTLRAVSLYFHQKFDLSQIHAEDPIVYFQWNPPSFRWICIDTFDRASCKFSDHFSQIPDLVTRMYARGIVRRISRLRCTGEAGILIRALADVFTLVFKNSMKRSLDSTAVSPDANHPISLETCRPQSRSAVIVHAFCTAIILNEHKPHGLLGMIWFRAMQTASETETLSLFARRTLAVSLHFNVEAITKGLIDAWVHVKVLRLRGPLQTLSIPKNYSEAIH